MRKIKELENRIASLETTIVEIKRKELGNQEVRRNRHIAVLDRLTGIEAKQKELEEALKIVVPIIEDILLQELVKNTLGIPSKLFAEISKKKENKKTDTKKTSKTKTKKESK